MSAAEAFLRRYPRAAAQQPTTAGAAPAATPAPAGGLRDLISQPRAGREARQAPAAQPSVVRPGGHATPPVPRPDTPEVVRPGGHGTQPPARRQPAPGQRPAAAAPAASRPVPPATPPAPTSDGLLDLFGDTPDTPGAPAPAAPTPAPASPAAAAPAPPVSGAGLLDLFPEPPTEPSSPPATAAGAQLSPGSAAAPAEAPGAAPAAGDPRRVWTEHFPRVSGRWQLSDTNAGQRVVVLNPVQAGTGYLTIAQPKDFGTPGRLQAVAELNDGRLIGSAQGVRNIDPVFSYSDTSLTVHLRLLHRLERFLVIFTPAPNTPAGEVTQIRLQDDVSQGTFDAHLESASQSTHIAVFSGFVVDGNLVIRLEERSFNGGVKLPFEAFGYPIGSPGAVGLLERP
jgi:hypothetical protein